MYDLQTIVAINAAPAPKPFDVRLGDTIVVLGDLLRVVDLDGDNVHLRVLAPFRWDEKRIITRAALAGGYGKLVHRPVR